MKIVIFSKYDYSGPSSRYRFYNYQSSFISDNIEFKILPLFSKSYTKILFKGSRYRKYVLLLFYYIRRILLFFFYLSNKNFVIQAEILPYFPPILERILFQFKKRVIIDFDDAIFHYYNSVETSHIVTTILGHKFDYILNNTTAITTGSSYLTSYCNKYNTNVLEIPTSIIFNKYTSIDKVVSNEKLIVGWLGSPSSSQDLLSIIPALFRFNRLYEFELHIMGLDLNLKDKFAGLPVTFFDWSESGELKFLVSIDVGIMPLIRNQYNQGKCGFKLIQYMAMGKLTISTPLEANVNININEMNLFAESIDEWYLALVKSNNMVKSKEYSLSNRNLIKEFFSVETNYHKMKSFYIKHFN